MNLSVKKLQAFCWLSLLLIGLSACGVKVQESDAKRFMGDIYEARKAGSLRKELNYYSKDKFAIVPFDEVASSLQSTLVRAGQLRSAKFLKAEVQKRNQLGLGMVQYLVLSYEVTYANLRLQEQYFFYGPSEVPEIVYLSLQL